MGITNSNKVIDLDSIGCDGSLRVTLALTAAPDIISNPTDIVLVLDRSGSMAGMPLESMKEGAKTFIDIIEEATDGVADGQIGSGSRIGIVSFAETAAVDAQLITSVDTLKDAVDSLSAGGSTNHADAFTKATELFTPPSGNARVIVMFTDGNITTGAPPAPVAAAARAQGIIIYCIGLVGTDGVDVNTLNEWATDPDATHVAVTPDAADLEALFAQLAANISKPGATDLVIDEIVMPDFEIVSITPPAKGTASMLDARSLRWTIPQLGVTASESATLAVYHKIGETVSDVAYTITDAGSNITKSGTVYLDYPDIGISQMKVLKEEAGKRTIAVTLYNASAATLAGSKDRTVKLAFYTDHKVKEAIDRAAQTLGRDGRIIVRPSGTEPLLRVMVEGQDEALIEKLAQDVAQVIREELV